MSWTTSSATGGRRTTTVMLMKKAILTVARENVSFYSDSFSRMKEKNHCKKLRQLRCWNCYISWWIVRVVVEWNGGKKSRKNWVWHATTQRWQKTGFFSIHSNRLGQLALLVSPNWTLWAAVGMFFLNNLWTHKFNMIHYSHLLRVFYLVRCHRLSVCPFC